MKKEVKRFCLVTRESKDVADLIRFTVINENPVIDANHKLGGRGYYISKEREVIETAKEKNLIHKILKVEVKPEFYDELLTYIE